MKHFKDVIARKRPRASAFGAADRDEETVPDFREIARAREKPSASDPIAEDDDFDDFDDFDFDDDPAPEPEADRPREAPVAPAMTREMSPETSSEPRARARQNIWEIENDDVPGHDPALRQRAQRAQAAAEALRQIEAQEKAKAGRSAETPASGAPSGGRAKTRILGFHASELEGDVFTAPKAVSSAAGQFPAGWIVVVDGPGRGASFTVCAGVSTIGRDPGQSICLDFGDMSVSRENHASIAYDDEQNRFFIGHGGKSNIVRRNGNPVLATEDLEDGDHIRIGKTTLRFVALCGPDFTWGGEEDRQNADAPDD